jgi:hypothetical protein
MDKVGGLTSTWISNNFLQVVILQNRILNLDQHLLIRKIYGNNFG